MPTPTDDRGGFFRGFRQSPVAYTAASAAMVGGAGLLVWSGLHLPEGPSGLPLLGMALIGAVLLWRHREPWAPKRRVLSELEKARISRRGAQFLALEGLVFGVTISYFAIGFWRSMMKSSAPMVSAGASAGSWALSHIDFLVALFASVVAGVFLAGSAVAWFFYRRLGKKIRLRQGRCLRCNYDLRGLPEPRCPECGTPFTPVDVRK